LIPSGLALYLLGVTVRAPAFLLVVLVALGLSCGFPQDCTVGLRDIGEACPESFDGTMEDLPRCGRLGGLVSGRTCGGIHELAAPELGDVKCHYDGVTHRLVGARSGSDDEVCAPGSGKLTAGRQPSAECLAAALTISQRCGGEGIP
jgi:hypothetical protein